MKISIGLKSFYSFLAYKSGYAARKINIRAKNNFLVLMYHRVLPSSLLSEDIEDGMYVTTESFEMHLKYLKKNFNVLPVSALGDSSLSDLKMRSKSPICFITFDDGWYDFYEYAFSID